MADPYDDIIDLPHHVSAKHARMPLQDRAAQFAPFAALTGYGAAIKETGRQTDPQLELEEDDRVILDRRQAFLCSILDEQPVISVTYFVPDARKAGGSYVTTEGPLKRVDEFARQLIFFDGTKISLDAVTAIESDCFSHLL